jgi:hypothetical protein
MAPKDNTIDITDLQTITLTVADLRAIVFVLECATEHLILPEEATTAINRLRKLVGTSKENTR